jgi:hypothetical protein
MNTETLIFFFSSSRLDLSHHGPLRPFKGAGVVADIQDATVKCLFLVKRRYVQNGFWVLPHAKIQTNSDLVSVEAMQWVLLYQSIGQGQMLLRT